MIVQVKKQSKSQFLPPGPLTLYLPLSNTALVSFAFKANSPAWLCVCFCSVSKIFKSVGYWFITCTNVTIEANSFKPISCLQHLEGEVHD